MGLWGGPRCLEFRQHTSPMLALYHLRRHKCSDSALRCARRLARTRQWQEIREAHSRGHYGTRAEMSPAVMAYNFKRMLKLMGGEALRTALATL